MKKLLLLFISVMICNLYLVPCYTQDETLTLLTYYPAPYGVYSTVQVGTIGHFLTIDYNTNHRIYSTNTDRIVLSHDGTANDLVINTNANIGIRTTNPGTDLTIGGTDSSILSLSTPGTDNSHESKLHLLTYDSDNNGLFVASDLGWKIAARGNAFTTAGQRNDLIFFWTQNNIDSPIMYLSHLGNVGINTTIPATNLTITGGQWPSMSLSLPPNSQANSTINILCSDDNLNGGFDGPGGSEDQGWAIRAYGPNASMPNSLQFVRVTNNNNSNTAIIIDQDGDVGIGVQELPDADLHVLGDVHVTDDMVIDSGCTIGSDTTSPYSNVLLVKGSIRAYLNNLTVNNDMDYDTSTREIGYDVAELFEANEEVEPGDVLSIDENGKLIKSTKPNDTKVIGIVSSAPAILFEGSQLVIAPEPFKFQSGTKPPLTLSGRVLCKVTTENGSIKFGDLLTTSSKPGYAMKASPLECGSYPNGCIIGKALEELKEGEGKILVLVSLM